MPETRKKQTETESESKSVSDQEPPQKFPIGRPTKYDPKLAADICVRISNGEPLRQICMDEGMPVQSTVYLWLSRFSEFSEMYTKAREDQADTLADEIQAIADDMPMQKVDKDGGTSFDSAYIQWMRLRVDARKWVAAKLKPRKYGDRVTMAGDEDNPLKVEASIEAKGLFNDLLLAMESRKQADGRDS
jgi:hypothetical protein